MQEPVPARSWNGKVFDATREGPTCLQYDSVTHVVKGTEDCLTLNVYTHKASNVTNVNECNEFIFK